MIKQINIFGNGFDLAHRYKTRYSDLLEFIKTNKEEFPHANELAIFIFKNKLVYNLWGELENNIHKIIKHTIKEYAFLTEKQLNEKNPRLNQDGRKVVYLMFRDLWGSIRKWLERKDWINNRSNDAKEKRDKEKKYFRENFFSLENKTLNITFNYTETIQDVYNFDQYEQNTIYLHGKVGSHNAKYIFGNSLDLNLDEYNKLIEEYYLIIDNWNESQKYVPYKSDIQRSIAEIFKQHGKKRFVKNKGEINKILSEALLKREYNSVILINIFGTSVSRLDRDYFKNIFNFFIKNGIKIRIKFYWFSEKDKINFKRLETYFGKLNVVYKPSNWSIE